MSNGIIGFAIQVLFAAGFFFMGWLWADLINRLRRKSNESTHEQ